MQNNHQYPQYTQQYPQQGMMYQQPIQPMISGHAMPQEYLGAPVNNIIPAPIGTQGVGLAGTGGLAKLNEQNGIFIKQKFEMAEMVLGCESRNRYNVYGLNADGNKKGRQLFKAKENSGTCARICLSGDCRPFKIDVSSTIRGEEENLYEPFLMLERPCKCTCLCWNRPELKITMVEGGRSEYIGKIVDPFNWCHAEMKIYDKDNGLKYTVLGNCCQLGFWCQCPCESCQTIDFEVKAPSGEVLSQLQKRTPGCLQAMTTDMDNFAMNFPKNCTPIDKALLMSAILLLDYRHFERNPQSNN